MQDDTPEGRIATLARALCRQMRKKFDLDPDTADFCEVLRPFIQRELILARVDEARKTSGRILTERARELQKELLALEFPDESDLYSGPGKKGKKPC